MDLTLHDVRPVDGAPSDETLDIGIHDGRIVEMRPNLAPGERSHRLDGRLVLAGFCESHIHLDKSCILERCALRGGLKEAIGEVAGLKADFTVEDVAARAARTLRKCVLEGTTRMRTHVEADPTVGLRGYEGVKAAARDFAWAIDVEICIFPQEGLTDNPGTDELLVEALRDGAGAIGGAPYVDTDPHGQIDRVFALAREFDVDVDLHLDFGPDTSEMTIDHVCRRTDEHGWGGRVAVGHVTRFAQMARPDFAALGRRLADAGVAVTVLPATDLFLMHREHEADWSVPRGVTPVHLMADAGVTCSLSTNNVLNPFTPFGDCSLIRMANLYANIAQIGSREGMETCLDMVSKRSARLMNLADYGLSPGRPADVVVLDATEPALAVAELAQPMLGFKRGRPSFTRPLPELHAPVPT
ncbi:MAG: amidohydrolase family protein [Paracoccaceae bacterium]